MHLKFLFVIILLIFKRIENESLTVSHPTYKKNRIQTGIISLFIYKNVICAAYVRVCMIVRQSWHKISLLFKRQ